MIYNSNENLFKEPEELLPQSRPTTPDQEVPRPNVELKVEKNYILDTKGRARSPINMTAKRLMKQTMKEFNKPIEPPDTPYCSPKHQMSIDFEVPPKINYDVVTNFPMGVARWARRHDGTICSHNAQNSLSQYCDVLGPYSCKKCIEITNRRIIAEIQKETFPELEFSITNIVAPRLCTALINGERLMSRERSTGLSRSVSEVRSKSILRLPSVGKVDARSFKRPGIESVWYERAKTFHTGDFNSPRYQNVVEDPTSATNMAEEYTQRKKSASFKSKSASFKSNKKTVRNVSISPVKTVAY